MWGLIHTYQSKEEVDEVLHLLELFFRATGKNDIGLLRPIGGLNGFFKRFLILMHADDDTVAGFSAKVLAVTGGKRYVAEIAQLLNTRDKSWTDEDTYPPVTLRGQAAVALSIADASEYKSQIAQLLSSMNEYDRSGACAALSRLKAVEYSEQIAALLLRKESSFLRDDSPIYALVHMGVAAQYKANIAAAMDDEFSSEANEAAIYALAHLQAKEYAPRIAKLLDHKYRRAYAAKALALMQAKEYAPRIAQLLDDKDERLDVSAAFLALSILRAKEYAPQIAAIMRADQKSYVSNDAAGALVLMDAREYAREVVPLLKRNKGVYVDVGDLNPLVETDIQRLNQEFRAKLAQFRRQAFTRRVGRDLRQSTHRTKPAGRLGA